MRGSNSVTHLTGVASGSAPVEPRTPEVDMRAWTVASTLLMLIRLPLYLARWWLRGVCLNILMILYARVASVLEVVSSFVYRQVDALLAVVSEVTTLVLDELWRLGSSYVSMLASLLHSIAELGHRTTIRGYEPVDKAELQRSASRRNSPHASRVGRSSSFGGLPPDMLDMDGSPRLGRSHSVVHRFSGSDSAASSTASTIFAQSIAGHASGSPVAPRRSLASASSIPWLAPDRRRDDVMSHGAGSMRRVASVADKLHAHERATTGIVEDVRHAQKLAVLHSLRWIGQLMRPSQLPAAMRQARDAVAGVLHGHADETATEHADDAERRRRKSIAAVRAGRRAAPMSDAGYAASSDDDDDDNDDDEAEHDVRCRAGPSAGGARTLPREVIFNDNSGKDTQRLVQAAGYPHRSYTVTTGDGYALLLDRIPRPESDHVVYCQHGITDSAKSWVWNNVERSLGFRLYDTHCDVWMGNFRGSCHTKHTDPSMTWSQFWDFNVNHHAFQDMPAFMEQIVRTKQAEQRAAHPGEPVRPVRVTVVAHSMGGMATLMYLVHCRKHRVESHVNKVILLSTAGYHDKVPMLARVTGPMIDAAIPPGFSAFRFPNERSRHLATKLLQDMFNISATRDLISLFFARLLGGAVKDHPSTTVPNIAYQVLSGTSVGVFRHFLQLMRSKRFQAFDYGPERNMREYGTRHPTDIMSNYHLIDVPVWLLMGLEDELIPPENILAHYRALHAAHPHQTFLKAFSSLGHLDFTVGMDDVVLTYILNIISPDPGHAASIPVEPMHTAAPALSPLRARRLDYSAGVAGGSGDAVDEVADHADLRDAEGGVLPPPPRDSQDVHGSDVDDDGDVDDDDDDDDVPVSVHAEDADTEPEQDLLYTSNVPSVSPHLRHPRNHLRPWEEAMPPAWASPRILSSDGGGGSGGGGSGSGSAAGAPTDVSPPSSIRIQEYQHWSPSH